MANLDSGGTAATKWKTLSLTHVEYPEGDKVNSGQRGRRPLCLFDVIKQIVWTVEHQRFK